MYAILDLESTGGKYGEEGITEVAIYKFDGEEIVDQFGSLINPERKIEPFVIKLTGINNDMLRYAPKFYEVAKRIIEITEGCTLVAHNAKFDYRLLRTEFKRLGYTYQRQTLCTVELSKNLIPGMPSYSLGKLVKNLGIPITDRHRAFGDAMATVRLFKLLLNKDLKKEIIGLATNRIDPTKRNSSQLNIVKSLPTETGIFYIYNQTGEIILLGKSTNIRRKVNDYFIKNTLKAKIIQKEAASVSYELTGNKLIATLKENEEIHRLQPKYNDQPAHEKSFRYGLYRTEKSNLIRLEKLTSQKELITPFKSLIQAEHFIKHLIQDHGIAPKSIATNNLIRIGDASNSIGSSHQNPTSNSATAVQKKLQAVIDHYSLCQENLLIVGPGRQPAEKSILLFENHLFKGIAYIALNHQLKDLKMVHRLLVPIRNTPFNRMVIQNFFQKERYKIVPFPTP